VTDTRNLVLSCDSGHDDTSVAGFTGAAVCYTTDLAAEESTMLEARVSALAFKPLETDAPLNNIKIFSSYLKENTRFHDNLQLVNPM
jgi:hypothetical protein